MYTIVHHRDLVGSNEFLDAAMCRTFISTYLKSYFGAANYDVFSEVLIF